MKKTEKIIDCVQDASGVYVPDTVVEEPKRKQTRRRQRSQPQQHQHQPQPGYQPIFMHPAELAIHRQQPYFNRPVSPFEDFCVGVDAGLDLFEHLADRLGRFTDPYNE